MSPRHYNPPVPPSQVPGTRVPGTRLALFLLLTGLTLAALSLLAHTLGLDPAAGWGPRRVALLAAGLLIAFIGHLPWSPSSQLRLLWRNLQSPIDRFARTDAANLLSLYWPAVPISALVILIYVWFATAGTWTTWESATRWYADLARGFERGNLYIPLKPSPTLLAAPDPYTLLLGGNPAGPTDLSYYDGHFYLPWGPTPALAALLFRRIFGWPLGDLQLAFGFMSATYLAAAALAILLWHRHFASLARGPLWIALLVLGLAGPMTSLLVTANGARVYEAAIMSGQFFLLAGMLCAMPVFARRTSALGLIAAGALWALAIASRITLVLPVGLIVMLLFARRLSDGRSLRGVLAAMLPLALVLALGLGLLGWYNWSRFGDPIQGGYDYQLSPSRVPFRDKSRIGLEYIVPNLINYLVYPPRLSPAFPFLNPEGGLVPEALLPAGHYYTSQNIVGMVWIASFAAFAVPAVRSPLARLITRRRGRRRVHCADLRELDWIALLLLAVAAGGAAYILVYHWAAMRYIMDFLPALMLISLIGYWSRQPGWRVAGGTLAALSITVSLLAALSLSGGTPRLLGFFAP